MLVLMLPQLPYPKTNLVVSAVQAHTQDLIQVPSQANIQTNIQVNIQVNSQANSQDNSHKAATHTQPQALNQLLHLVHNPDSQDSAALETQTLVLQPHQALKQAQTTSVPTHTSKLNIVNKYV